MYLLTTKMRLFQNRSDFNHYFRIQWFSFLAAVPICIAISYTQHSGWYLLGPIATIPFAYLLFQMMRLTADGSVNVLYGMGRGKQIYSKSLLFEADMEKANSVRREGNLPEAILLYNKITELAFDRAEPLFEMANTYRMAQEKEKARALYIKVLAGFAESLGMEHYIISESRTRARELSPEFKVTGERPKIIDAG